MLVFLTFLFMSAACGRAKEVSIPFTDEEITWIREHPVVRIAPDPDFPPVEYFDEKGVYRGISADFMRLIGERTGLTFEEVRCRDWVDVLERARKGEIDVLTAASATPDRETYLRFTKPHIVLPGVIVCRKKVKGPITLKDLKRKKVCVVHAYVWQDYLEREHPEITLMLVPDVSTGLKRLSFEYCDAFIGTLPVVLYYIEKDGISNLRIMGESGYYTRLAVAVRKDAERLFSIMSKAVASIAPDEKQKIIARYISAYARDRSFSRTFFYATAIVVGVAGVVFVWVLLWNRILARKVEKHTQELKEELIRRKNIEEILRQNRDLLFDVFESIQDGIWVLNMDFTVRFANKVMKRVYGYTDEMKGKKTCYQILLKQKEPCGECPVLKCLDSGRSESRIIPVLSGPVRRWIETHVYPMKDRKTGEITGIIEFFRDVTERRRMADTREIIYRITESVEKTKDVVEFCRHIKEALSRVMDTRNFIVGLYDERDNSLLLKYVADESDRVDWVSLKHTISGKVIHTNKPFLLQEEEIEELIEKGKIKLVGAKPHSWLGVPLRLENRVIGLIIVQSYDPGIIYRNEDLQLLEFLSAQIASAIHRVQARASIRKLFTAVEQSPVLVIIMDRDFRIEYVNPMVTKVTGYSYDELVGRKPDMFRSETRTEKIEQEICEAIMDGRAWQGEWQSRKKDGSLYWETVHVSPIRDEGGKITHIISIKQDITQQKRMQEELQQIKKMESIGTLSGGIAHDFNNLLTPILGYVEMLIENRPPEDPIVQDLKEVKEAAEKARSLVWKLLAFSRKQTLSMKRVDINVLVRDFIKIFKRTFREDIEVTLDLNPEIPLILADSTQIDQVLVNFVSNAQDAMPEGGVLSFRTYPWTLEEHSPQFRQGMQPGLYVVLEISDTGIGMDKHLIQHIFEPFFTTKEVGKGTGMGLATVYGIIKQHKGDIHVYSEPGKGSTFKIYFPADKGEVNVKNEKKVETKSVNVFGKETIMIVEDNPAVKNLLVRILKKYGYRVIALGHPRDALEKITHLDVPLDLLITDIIMPEMNGRELYRQMRASIPGLKVLYMSGYTRDIIEHHGIVEDNINFIQKPISIHVLVTKIREILNK